MYGSTIGSMIVPAALGGAGAVGFDILWGQISANPSFPASLNSGWAQTAAEVVALWAALNLLEKGFPHKRRQIAAAALGAGTVIAYNALKGVAANYLPAAAGLSGYMPAQRFPMGSLGRLGRLGAYQDGRVGRLAGLNDLYDPAPLVQSPAPRQFGALGRYRMAAQPHTWGGSGVVGAFGDLSWQNDGM